MVETSTYRKATDMALSLSDNRLSDSDRQAIRLAMLHPHAYGAASVMVRAGAHSIGCGLRDLRESEINELEKMADDLAAGGAPTVVVERYTDEAFAQINLEGYTLAVRLSDGRVSSFRREAEGPIVPPHRFGDGRWFYFRHYGPETSGHAEMFATSELLGLMPAIA